MLFPNAPILASCEPHNNDVTFPDLLGLTKEDPNAKIFLSFSTKFATALTNRIPFWLAIRS